METLTLEFENARAIQATYGGDEKLLRELEARLAVKVTTRDGWLRIEGKAPDVDRANQVFEQLRDAVKRGVAVRRHEFTYALKSVEGETGAQAGLGHLLETRIQCSARKPPVIPKTAGQKAYIQAIQNHDITFGVGPAGTGKTYLAVALAVAALKQEKVSRIVLTRPAVEAGEALGFLPGDLQEKILPYLRPLYDALYDMMPASLVAKGIAENQIEIAPLAFMRGRTLSSAFVILDEAQNTTPQQMKMFLTRLGEGSRMVVTGDPTQVDLPSGISSGLADAVTVLKGVTGVASVGFNNADIVRHALVGRIVAAYDKKAPKPKK